MKRSTRGAIAPFLVMEAVREAAKLQQQGRDILHLSVGQPGDAPPERVRQKAAELLKTHEDLGYTESAGILPLRQRIAQHYLETYGLMIPVERIFVTVGSSAAFFLGLLAAFDEGDEVAISQPHYAAYPNMLDAVDLVPVFMRSNENARFQPTVEMIEALPRKPAGLILASPANPTGSMVTPKVLKELAEYGMRNEIRIISDEIYHGITYGDKAHSILEYTDRAIVVNSFSKYYLMPGWRLGWAVVPPDLVRSFECLLQNFFISPPTLAQHAGVAVFDCKDELDAIVQNYAKNRAILLEELPKMGIDRFAPVDGAFYLYAYVGHLTNDSAAWCDKILHDTGVVIVSGKDFDRDEGHAYVRISYCATEATIREAMKRLKEWVGR